MRGFLYSCLTAWTAAVQGSDTGGRQGLVKGCGTSTLVSPEPVVLFLRIVIQIMHDDRKNGLPVSRIQHKTCRSG